MHPGLPSMPMPLSIALRGFGALGTGPAVGAALRELLSWSGATGFSAVCLDATSPGLRPRDLDRSARRDLAASMRRAGVVSGGIDLFLPPDHLNDPAWADRAVGAVVGALGLSAELASLTSGRAVVSMVLPPAGDGSAWTAPVIGEAQRVGARVADCVWPVSAHADPVGPIGIGIDAASVMAGGGDPGREVSRAGAGLAAVRVADWDGASRVPVGRGRLDVLALRVAIATSGFAGYVVVDARGVGDARAAAEVALDRLGGRPGGAASP